MGGTLFDLNLFPFTASAPGNLIPPGMLVIQPTRKAARGRENDVLLIYFSLNGSTSITADGLHAWLEKKAESYHHNPGTVTAGLRAIIEAINADLLERNLRRSKEGEQVTGHLQVAVLKRETLYLANIGNTRGFLITQNEATQISDTENGARGLGVSQSVTVRFTQTMIATNDLLMFAVEPPPTWTPEALAGSQALSMDGLARRLFSQATGNARGVIIRFQEGTGKVNTLSLRSTAHQTVSTQPAQPVQMPVSEKKEQTEVAVPKETPVSTIQAEALTSKPVIAPAQQNIPQPVRTGATFEPAKTHVQGQEQPVESENRLFPRVKLPESVAVKNAVGDALRSGARAKEKADGWLKDAVQKVLPGAADQPIRFSKGLLIFIAIVVPVIIVAIATSLYIRNGRNGLFDAYLAQAEQLSVRADSQTSDSPSRLASLQESIYWLDKADQYGQSTQSAALRSQVQTGLDELEGITRINLQTMLDTALASSVNIVQIVTSSTDVYVLDGNSGKVLRLFQSGPSYQQDSSFDCGPNPQNPLNAIGNLVDMVTISPDNSYGASVMAIDGKGVLEYCVPGDTGYVVNLAQPDMGWGSVQSIALNQSSLYVLDIRGNAVYRFDGDGVNFKDKPTLFFDDVIPSLTLALDIEVVGDELYILRSNGQMIECTYSALKTMKSTECEDPAPYADTRTGQVAEAVTFPEAAFIQMHLTLAPDSSLYLLDSTGKTIYHLSYARSLQRVLHPRLSDGENISRLTPSAFAVSTNRIVFMAFGNQLYSGQMP